MITGVLLLLFQETNGDTKMSIYRITHSSLYGAAVSFAAVFLFILFFLFKTVL